MTVIAEAKCKSQKTFSRKLVFHKVSETNNFMHFLHASDGFDLTESGNWLQRNVSLALISCCGTVLKFQESCLLPLGPVIRRGMPQVEKHGKPYSGIENLHTRPTAARYGSATTDKTTCRRMNKNAQEI